MKKATSFLAAVAVAAAVAGGIFWLNRPATITLPDGARVTLLGVEFGKHHVYPDPKIPGERDLSPMSFDTTNDTLVVWVLQEHKADHWPDYQAVIYDRRKTACLNSSTREYRTIKRGAEVAGLEFNAFPRADRKFFFGVVLWGNQGEQRVEKKLSVANPARRYSYPAWTPRPLPDTQADGDLQVTLNRLTAATPSPYGHVDDNLEDPADRYVRIDFTVRQNGQVVTNWQPQQVETADATGNHIRSFLNNPRPDDPAGGYYYQSGLWPTQPWKVRLEFSRTTGFSPDETFTITNVPVLRGPPRQVWNEWTNSAAVADTVLHGISLKVFPAVLSTNRFQNGRRNVAFKFTTDADLEAEGLRFSLVSATDDQGRELQNRTSRHDPHSHLFLFIEPPDTQTLNFTVAVHKSRFVEFTVDPAKP